MRPRPTTTATTTPQIPTVLTLGVEEEFLLLDPATGESMPVADRVRGALSGTAREQSRRSSGTAWSRW